MKTIFIIIGILCVVVIGFWLALPERVIVEDIEGALKERNLTITMREFKKGLFYNFSAKDITIRNSHSTIASIDTFTGTLDFGSLFHLDAKVKLQGTIGQGKVIGIIGILRERAQREVEITNAPLEKIPFFTAPGINARGLLALQYTGEGDQGRVKLRISDLRISHTALQNFFPLDLLTSAQGVFMVQGDMITIDALSFEGKGMYARIKGTVSDTSRRLTFEIMPDASLANAPFHTFLSSYRVSPGYYAIPLEKLLNFCL